MGLRVLHIFLASIIFLSTVGVTINKHYCKEQLRSTALWLVPKSCHEAKIVDSKLPSCPFHAQGKKLPKCCSDKSDYIKSEIQQNITTDDFRLIAPLFTSFHSLLAFEKERFAFVKSDYAIYCFHPPPERTSRSILYQQFLI